MPRRLPPLNALRAFEAAARHLSFTKAASELNVTQAAVSHQVKALEERLCIQLFVRMNRQLLLTEAGQAYLPAIRDAFDMIATASERLVSRGDSGPLKVTSLNSFAAKWLLPRLPDFRKQHPDIDILVHASDTVMDYVREGFHCGLRYGLGRYPGMAVDFLMADRCFPFCSPRLMDGPHPLTKLENLRYHTLLSDDASRVPGIPDWSEWLAAANVKGVDPSHGLTYNDSAMLVQAAVEGQGVAMGRLSLAEGDLAAGRLIKPFDLELRSQYSYYLTIPPGALDRPKVRAFREWVIEEARKSPLGAEAQPQSTGA